MLQEKSRVSRKIIVRTLNKYAPKNALYNSDSALLLSVISVALVTACRGFVLFDLSFKKKSKRMTEVDRVVVRAETQNDVKNVPAELQLAYAYNSHHMPNILGFAPARGPHTPHETTDGIHRNRASNSP